MSLRANEVSVAISLKCKIKSLKIHWKLKIKNWKFVLIIIAAMALLILAGFWQKTRLLGWYLDWQKSRLPQASEEFSSVISSEARDPTTSSENDGISPPRPRGRNDDEALSAKPSAISELPTETNLDAPFTSQAPYANWDYTHEEACEEAALLIIHRYHQGRDIAGPDDAEAAIQEIIGWENEHLGFFESTTAEELSRVAKEMLGYRAEVIYSPTIEQIKQEIAADRPVLGLFAGREIGNPFYKQPGPLYHAMVIKGYTKEQFITNDPGTRRGENYPYDYNVIMDALGDWNNGDPADGMPAVLFIQD